jgi:hypothetical protein
MSENQEIQKTPVNTPIAKNSKKGRINSIFQKDPDDEDVVLVPIENIKNSKLTNQPVVELSNNQIRTSKYVSEETRLKRIEQGKKLAEFRKNKLAENAKVKQEQLQKEEDERQLRIKEEIEAHKKEIEKKILEGKLVRVKLKQPKMMSDKIDSPKGNRLSSTIPEEDRLTNKTKVKKTPKKKEIVMETETETETDTDVDNDEKEARKSSFKKVQKKIDKKIEEIKKIDETINQYKNPYLDKLMSLMK